MQLVINPNNPEPRKIQQALDVMRSGGVVAYPTDTLYGLAVDPRDGDAVARLYAAKGRGQQSAIPLIAASLDQAQGAAILDGLALQLARAVWPGPLTIVAPARRGLAAAVLGGGTTVAVRVPAHAVARALAAAFGFCITATSANRSGESPAVTGADVAAAFATGSDVDVLLDAGVLAGGPPSTIVEIGKDGPRLIRAGVVSWDRVLESLK
jgi:L-threonylcarbamoyladenylate synthase